MNANNFVAKSVSAASQALASEPRARLVRHRVPVSGGGGGLV
jgi:hypothetical protein